MKAANRKTVMLRFENGRFVPADMPSAAALRDRKYNIGDILSAELRKARNPKFWRMVHQLGTALIENTDDFAHYTDSHAVLKRIQLEANIECDSIAIKSEYGLLEHRVPRSLSFESMDQGTFDRVYSAFCQHVIDKYWSEFDEAQIEQVASLVGMAA